MNFPVIDPVATGRRINDIRKDKGFSVNDLKDLLGLSTTYAVYKWLHGDSIPSIDNLLALSMLFGMSINDMIVVRS